jgi:hypothetical protein
MTNAEIAQKQLDRINQERDVLRRILSRLNDEAGELIYVIHPEWRDNPPPFPVLPRIPELSAELLAFGRPPP